MIRRVAIALLIAAEALMFYTLGEVAMRVLSEPGNEVVNAPAFVIIAFVAFLSPLAFDWFALERRARVLATFVLGLVVFYGALRIQYASDLALWDFGWVNAFVTDTGSVEEWISAVLVSSLLLIGTWARASWRARDEVWIENAPRSLVIPFALVTLSLAFTAGSEQATVVTRGGVVFYGVALSALAASQLGQTGATIGTLRSGGVTTVMLVATGLFAALGVVLVGVLLDPLIDVLKVPVQASADVIVWVVTWVFFYPIVWVVGGLVDLIISLFGSSGGPPAEPQLESALDLVETDLDPDELDSDLVSETGQRVLAILALVAGVGVVGAIILVLAILSRRRGRSRDDGVETEGVGSPVEDLLQLARSLFRRDRARQPGGEGVVRLYLDVLDASRQAGQERAAGQTPREFAPTLSTTLQREITSEITTAFEDARYADRPPGESALADLRRRWERPEEPSG